MMRQGSKNGGAMRCRIHGGRILAILATTLAVLFLTYSAVIAPGIYWPWLQEKPEMSVHLESQHSAVSSNRKLLAHGMMIPAKNFSAPALPDMSSVTPERVGDGCTKDDIVIHQGAAAPLPNGIPTYTVQVLNVCAEKADTGCELGQIHFSCGWFASARLVNPRIFRRLRYDDCLVNDSRPLPSGSTLTFQYANSFPYQLSVSTASCVST